MAPGAGLSARFRHKKARLHGDKVAEGRRFHYDCRDIASRNGQGAKTRMIDHREAERAPRRRARGLLAAALAVPLLASACASNGDIDLAAYVDSVEPADTLYNQGLANLEAGRMTEASRKFDAVDRQHPYSEHARKAMVMGAFTNYRQGK